MKQLLPESRFYDGGFHYQIFGVVSANEAAVFRDSAADLFAIKTKKTTKPLRTESTTKSSEITPQLNPLANSESLLPKQTEQAEAVFGHRAKNSTVAKKINRVSFEEFTGS